MAASTPLGPFPAPHKTKQFWAFGAVIAAAVICAPLVQSLLGLPPFTWRVQLSSGAITFSTMLVAGWLAFRFGRIGGLHLPQRCLFSRFGHDHMADRMSRPTSNQSLQPTADRRENLHMTDSTLKFAAKLASASGGLALSR
jgi:hypothetical protein